MPAEKVVKPRTAFRQLINYLQREMIDFEKLENDDMLNTYYHAMRFVGEVAGNTAYSPFYRKDSDILVLLAANTLSMQEISERTERNVQSLAPSLAKLVNLGLATNFTERVAKVQNTYYTITPYGLKFLEELIADEDSAYYI